MISLRIRLLLLLLVIFSAIAAVAVWQAMERRETDTRQFLDSLKTQSKFIVEQQGAAIRRAERFLEFMTSSLDPYALAQDPKCPEKLQTYTKNDLYLANLFITNTDGQVICNPRDTLAPPDVSDRAYFREAVASTRSIIGDPLYGRFSGRWVLPFSKRFVEPQGRVMGVMVAALDMAWIDQAFQDIPLPSGIRLGLVTSKGVVLARQPDSAQWVGRNISDLPAFKKLIELNGDGMAETVSHDGQVRFYIFTPFAKTTGDAIYLWQTIPKEVVTAKADSQFLASIAIIGALAVLSFTLVWFGVYRLFLQPLDVIANAARRIAKGEVAVKTGLSDSCNEIGQLALAFDEMTSRLALFDAVTGLLNRHAFEKALEAMLADAQQRSLRVAVIRLQLKDYDRIEAAHGQAFGIAVVKQVGLRLQAVLGGAVLLARLGESSFALLWPQATDTLQVSGLVERLRLDVENQPLEIEDRSIHVQLGFGVCFYPEDGETAVDLMQHAGAALGLAMKTQNNPVRYYERAMDDWLSKRARRLVDLQRALKAQEFELHYQPQLDLLTGRVAGLEALVRWRHPQEGLISPAEFIPLAEESGFIIPLGQWILTRAVTQLVEWRTANPALNSLVMAVNISAAQLISDDLESYLQRLLAHSGLPPDRLELEITESQLMQLSSEPDKLLQRLKSAGVLLAIDDFGTGYSSLSYLKHFAVDKLKIDKIFVDNVAHGADDEIIIEAAIAMAHKLGLVVIAEGVESPEQVDALRRLSCDQIQGYVFSRPLPAGDALQLITANDMAEA